MSNINILFIHNRLHEQNYFNTDRIYWVPFVVYQVRERKKYICNKKSQTYKHVRTLVNYFNGSCIFPFDKLSYINNIYRIMSYNEILDMN